MYAYAVVVQKTSDSITEEAAGPSDRVGFENMNETTMNSRSEKSTCPRNRGYRLLDAHDSLSH